MNLIIDFINQTSSLLLDLDPDGKSRLAPLSGKVICIQFTMPAATLFLQPGTHGIRVNNQAESEPDVTLTGSLPSFIRLGASATKSGVLSSGRINMQGDVDTGQAFQKALSQLDIDWEELLAQYTGDTAARKAGKVLREMGEWAKESVTLSGENLADYLTEEKRILPTRLAVERLQKSVDDLRSDVDRMEQRIVRFKNRMKSLDQVFSPASDQASDLNNGQDQNL